MSLVLLAATALVVALSLAPASEAASAAVARRPANSRSEVRVGAATRKRVSASPATR